MFNIIRQPRPFERQDGSVEALTPSSDWWHAQRRGGCTLADFERAYRDKVERRLADLEPGRLSASGRTERGERSALVTSGDTLISPGSRDKAAAGRCVRAWAAEYLRRAGWRVILDGKEFE